MNDITYSNIFYVDNFNVIGGTETFIYYLIRNYGDIDITVVYRTADLYQINRLKQYVRCKQFDGSRFKCKKAFFNYSTNIIDNVDAEEYIQVIHTKYDPKGDKPRFNPKITKFIGVSQVVCDCFKELTGKDCELCYNPLFIEKPKKVLNLISATRLSWDKGKGRIIELARQLDEARIPYLWHIFTDDTLPIDNPNIVYMKPRLDITDYISNADYLVQLSDNVEGYGYTPVEALIVGTPVIVTDNDAFREIGMNETNGFVLNLDMTNVPIQEIYDKAGKFNFKYEPPKNRWNEILVPTKSTYKEELNWKAKVRCIRRCGYDDIRLLRHIDFNEEYIIPYHRAEFLKSTKDIEILEIIKES